MSQDEDAAPRHHKYYRHKQSKHRPYAPPDSDLERLSPQEVVYKEKEHKNPGRRHRNRETVDTTYQPEKSDISTDGASTDDGERRRRKNYKHRRRERILDNVSSTLAQLESGTDVDDDSKPARSGSRKGMRDRAKGVGESAIAVLGLEETYRKARSKSRERKPSMESDEGHDSSSERNRPRNRSRSRSWMNTNTARAAIIAAVVEAFRSRKEPGGVTGWRSLKRVVEAAVASGAVEKFLDRKGEDDKKPKIRIAESVLAGLVVQWGINWIRSKKRGSDDKRADLIKDSAASDLIAAAGKKFLDYQRSRSQSRPRARSESGSPERPGLNRRRSRSMSKALTASGLGGFAAERFGLSRRDSRSSRASRKLSGIRDDTSSDGGPLDSDVSLDEDAEKKRDKALRRKEIISVALTILATLHLGHVGYEALEKRAARKEKLGSGKITEEESSKLRNKTLLKDTTAVGLAILAAAEAVKAFKGIRNSRREFHESEEKRQQIEEHRRRKAIQRAAQGDRAPSPRGGEASRYYSQPGYMGPPPGVAHAGEYPCYPASGPIPNDYVSRGSYNTKDGREIPEVHPSSVTHA